MTCFFIGVEAHASNKDTWVSITTDLKELGLPALRDFFNPDNPHFMLSELKLTDKVKSISKDNPSLSEEERKFLNDTSAFGVQEVSEDDLRAIDFAIKQELCLKKYLYNDIDIPNVIQGWVERDYSETTLNILTKILMTYSFEELIAHKIISPTTEMLYEYEELSYISQYISYVLKAKDELKTDDYEIRFIFSRG